jgi:hypothetical protein
VEVQQLAAQQSPWQPVAGSALQVGAQAAAGVSADNWQLLVQLLEQLTGFQSKQASALLYAVPDLLNFLESGCSLPTLLGLVNLTWREALLRAWLNAQQLQGWPMYSCCCCCCLCCGSGSRATSYELLNNLSDVFLWVSAAGFWLLAMSGRMVA